MHKEEEKMTEMTQSNNGAERLRQAYVGALAPAGSRMKHLSSLGT